MSDHEEIGKRLSDARQKKKLSVEAASRATRIQSSMITALEEGKADSMMSRVYVVLFLKKYAKLLDLDPEALAREYKSSFKGEEKQIFDIKKDPPEGSFAGPKILEIAIYVLTGALVISVIFISTAKLRLFYRAGRKVTAQKITPSPASSKAKNASAFPIAPDEKITLRIKGENESWLRVNSDGKKVFEGILKKNESKELTGDNELELWVGRLEVLDFYVNGKSTGKLGNGTVKGVKISKEGIKIGKDWIVK